MKGKVRILLDVRPENEEIVQTLANRIYELNQRIQNEEQEVGKLRTNLNDELKSLSKEIEARNQILDALDKLKIIKKKKNIDVEMPNPSEKISTNNPKIELCIEEEEWKRLEKIDRENRKLEKETKENANNTR